MIIIENELLSSSSNSDEEKQDKIGELFERSSKMREQRKALLDSNDEQDTSRLTVPVVATSVENSSCTRSNQSSMNFARKYNQFKQQKNGEPTKPYRNFSNNDLKSSETVVAEERNVYVELELLKFHHEANERWSNFEWQISNRWIKYEQVIDTETSIWSKPFVGPVVYQNLVYLKNTLQYSTIILNAQHDTSFECIIDDMLSDFINRGDLLKEKRDELKEIILTQHRTRLGFSDDALDYNNNNNNNLNNNFGADVYTRKSALSDLFSSDRKQSKLNKNFSFAGSMLNKKGSTNNLTRSNRHLPSSVEHNKADESICLNRINADRDSVKFYIEGNANDSSSIEIGDNFNTNINRSRRSTLNMLKSSLIHRTKTIKTGLHDMQDVEVFLIMVGVVDFLDKPVMAFIRLTNDQYMDNFIDYQIKVRFIFIFLGPSSSSFSSSANNNSKKANTISTSGTNSTTASIDYHEVGRCIGTMMTDRDFVECAYAAKKKQDLIQGINEFCAKCFCVAVPLGRFDEDLLTPIASWTRVKMNSKMRSRFGDRANKVSASSINLCKSKEIVSNYDNFDTKKLDDKHHKAADLHFDPFKRTGRAFGALRKEICTRYAHYFSDIRDGLNMNCLISFVFIFTVCIAPALCFGGILADKTDNWFGINEILLASSLNGIVFALFSGQPLMILGATGPFLVFEEMVYKYCVKIFCIEFLSTRIWIALWILVFTLLMICFEFVHVIRYVSRFAEEIFAILIACVFLIDAFKKIIHYFVHNPIHDASFYYRYSSTTNTNLFQNQTSTNYANESLIRKSLPKSVNYRYDKHADEKTLIGQPNLALISTGLLIGTCALALLLKKLRRSRFFESSMRRTLSDVGILISIVLMVFFNYIIEHKTSIKTEKLDKLLSDEILPTQNRLRKSWFVSPFGNNYESGVEFSAWIPFAAILPALVIFVVLFFEIELTGLMLNAKHRKLVKGSGFHLDLLISALMLTFNSFFGLPWLCAAPVRTLAHWASLCIYSKSIIPGEKPQLVLVQEQRITNIMVHIAIGLCLKGKDLLKHIPFPVLFGIILYFGIVSMSGTQLFERIKCIFIPYKYCPNLPYANGLRPSKRNAFTLIQIVAVVILLCIKAQPYISFVFPLVLVALVLLRKFLLPFMFSKRELEQLDDEYDYKEDDIIHDFYELIHLPI